MARNELAADERFEEWEPAAKREDEEARCGMCGRRVRTHAPDAICTRCSDELHGGGAGAAGGW